MARALIGSASAKMAALAESQCVVLCEAPHGYGKSAAAVKFSFDEMTVAAEHRREFSATSVSQPEVCQN